MARPPPIPSAHEDTRLTHEETTAITALLREGIPGEDADLASGSASARAGDPIVLRYDLVAGAARGGEELPGLQLAHERFASELSNEFRRAVGDEGTMIAERVSFSKFADIYARLEVPTVVIVANVEGVGCSALISMEPALAMHFIDLLMGGEGGAVQLRGDLIARGLTQAEKGVLRHVVAIMSRALATSWRDFANVGLEIVRVGTDPRHAAIFEPSEPMAELVVRVEWGAIDGAIHMSLPTNVLTQFDGAFARTAQPNIAVKAESGGVEMMRTHLLPVVVNLSAILGTAEMTLERLLSLERGDVVRLDADHGEPVEIRVEGEQKMRGFPTVQHGNVAVRIEEFLGDDLSDEGDDDGQPPQA